MFKITSNGIVTVNRGDSFEFPVILKLGSSMDELIYNLGQNDVLYLGIMEPNQMFEHAIIRKKFTYQDLDSDGNVNIRFWPEDTMFLRPGKYYYQIKLETEDFDHRLQRKRKDIETVVDKTLFYIQE